MAARPAAPLAFLWQPGLAATPAACLVARFGSPTGIPVAAPAGRPVAAPLATHHRTALLLGCELAHPLACGLFNYSFLSSRSLNERVCQNDNWTNSAKMASCACFVKLTLRACSVKLLLPVCCCCRLFSPAARASSCCQLLLPVARASSSATAPRPAPASRWNSAATLWLATAQP